MKVPSFQHAVGFSVGDTLSLFLLRTLVNRRNYSRPSMNNLTWISQGAPYPMNMSLVLPTHWKAMVFFIPKQKGAKKSFKLLKREEHGFRNMKGLIVNGLAKCRMSSIDFITI